MDSEEKVVVGVIGTATGVSATAGSLTVLVTTTKILGITVATTTVAVPVFAIIATGGLLTYGGYKMWKSLRAIEGNDDLPHGQPPGEAERNEPRSDRGN